MTSQSDYFKARLEETRAQKEQDLAEASVNKKLALDPSWVRRDYNPDQVLDADTLQFQDDLDTEGNPFRRRLSSEARGVSPDAFETSATRFDNPKNPRLGQYNEEQQRLAIARETGRDPDSVSREEIFAKGNQQTQQTQDFFANAPVEEGDTPHLYTKDLGKDDYGRTLTAIKNSQGENLADLYAGRGDNAGFDSKYNALEKVGDLTSKEFVRQEILGGPRSIDEIVGDTFKTVLRSAAKTTADSILGAADFLDPTGAVMRLFGGEGAGTQGLVGRAIKSLELDKHLQNFEDWGKSKLSPQEQQGQRYAEERNKAWEAGRPERVKEHIANGLSANEIAFKEFGADALFMLKDLMDNPVRALNVTAEGLGTMLPILLGGAAATGLKVAGMQARGVSLASKAGKAEIKKFQLLSGMGLAGFTEAGSAATQMRNRVAEMSDEEISNSPEGKKLIASGLTVEQARNEISNDASKLAYVGSLALSAAVTGVLGKVGLSGDVLVAKTLNNPIAQSALGGTAGRRIAAAGTAGVLKEGPEEFSQETGATIVGNVVEQKLIDPNKRYTEGAGQAGVAGAIGGMGAGGAIQTTAASAKEVKRAVKGTPVAEKPASAPGRVVYRNGEEGIDSGTKKAVSNLGMDVVVNSGYRTKEQNQKVKGAKHSKHLSGKAVDISLRNMSTRRKQELLVRAIENGDFKYAKVYQNHIHLDTENRQGKEFHLDPANAPGWALATVGAQKVGALTSRQTTPTYSQKFTGTRKAVPNTPVAKALDSAITRAEKSYNLPPIAGAYLRAAVEIESSWGAQNTGKPVKGGDPAQEGKRAHGPWMFMKNTAARMGLTDPYDIKASTQSAAKMLRQSYDVQRRLAEQRGEKVTEEGLWRAAMIGHHSGSGWKVLGPAGRDYAKKLDINVQKYLSKGVVGDPGVKVVRAKTTDFVGKKAKKREVDVRKKAEEQIKTKDFDNEKAVAELLNIETTDYGINDQTRLKVHGKKEIDDLVLYKINALKNKDTAEATKANKRIHEINDKMRAVNKIILSSTVKDSFETLGSPEGKPTKITFKTLDDVQDENIGNVQNENTSKPKKFVFKVLDDTQDTNENRPTEQIQISALVQAAEAGLLTDEHMDAIKESDLAQEDKDVLASAQKLSKISYDVAKEKLGYSFNEVQMDKDGTTKLVPGLRGHQDAIVQSVSDYLADETIPYGQTVKNKIHAFGRFYIGQRDKLNNVDSNSKLFSQLKTEFELIDQAFNQFHGLYKKAAGTAEIRRQVEIKNNPKSKRTTKIKVFTKEQLISEFERQIKYTAQQREKEKAARQDKSEVKPEANQAKTEAKPEVKPETRQTGTRQRTVEEPTDEEIKEALTKLSQNRDSRLDDLRIGIRAFGKEHFNTGFDKDGKWFYKELTPITQSIIEGKTLPADLIKDQKLAEAYFQALHAEELRAKYLGEKYLAEFINNNPEFTKLNSNIIRSKSLEYWENVFLPKLVAENKKYQQLIGKYYKQTELYDRLRAVYKFVNNVLKDIKRENAESVSIEDVTVELGSETVNAVEEAIELDEAIKMLEMARDECKK